MISILLVLLGGIAGVGIAYVCIVLYLAKGWTYK